MSLVTELIRRATAPRMRKIQQAGQNPSRTQARQFEYLMRNVEQTVFGRDHSLHSSTGYTEFCNNVEVADYGAFVPYVERVRRGEKNVLWPGRTSWLAKSSGTTGGRSKYIPVTAEGIRFNHLRGMKDVAAISTHTYPESALFDGKTLTLGGSHSIERQGEWIHTGDLSAILIEHTPHIARRFRLPRMQTALTADFDRKIENIYKECSREDVRSIAGVPSWNLVMLSRILEYSGKQNIHEVWPNLELFVYGGVSFRPYRDVFQKIAPSPRMKYMETYNASEGFFAIADRVGGDDMLLMTDYGMFYEFLPTDSLDDTSKVVPLEGVRTGINYAMIISNCNGLWRYMIGDTVEFTCTEPYRLRITGRTRSYINTFGEELIVDNADGAISEACTATDASVAEYTVAPIYMDEKSKGAHQWIVEFRQRPRNMEVFSQRLDEALRRRNSDYDAKRNGGVTLLAPVVTPVPENSFMKWMRSTGRLGGQNKVPRLSNDRTVAEQILETIK